MNSVHDLGGTHGFGPVVRDDDDRPFHADWERRTFGVEFAAIGHGFFNVDEIRYATELMEPVAYLSSTYFEHWLACTETLLVAKGVLTWEEIDARAQEFLGDPSQPLPDGEDPGVIEPLVEAIRGGISAGAAIEPPPRFAPGDKVVTWRRAPAGHTRLPRYARGKVGTVVRVGPALPLPDANAHLRDEQPEHTYQIRFEAGELWGDAAADGDAIFVDVWESYIEPVEAGEGRD